MATVEERMKILKLIQDGKITAEEGAKLLSALGSSGRRPSSRPRSTMSSRYMRVRVTETATGKAKVNVNLPLKLVDAGLNIAAQFIPDLDLNSIMEAINDAVDDNLLGKIIDVVDEEDGEHVEIIIE